jgi:hypothetical protein
MFADDILIQVSFHNYALCLVEEGQLTHQSHYAVDVEQETRNKLESLHIAVQYVAVIALGLGDTYNEISPSIRSVGDVSWKLNYMWKQMQCFLFVLT